MWVGLGVWCVVICVVRFEETHSIVECVFVLLLDNILGVAGVGSVVWWLW